MVETLCEAKANGWRITARCAWGRRQGMKSVRECLSRYELDLETLIWTRGAEFPLSMLAERLKCPRCGSRRVVLLFNRPGRTFSEASWLVERVSGTPRPVRELQHCLHIGGYGAESTWFLFGLAAIARVSITRSRRDVASAPGLDCCGYQPRPRKVSPLFSKGISRPCLSRLGAGLQVGRAYSVDGVSRTGIVSQTAASRKASRHRATGGGHRSQNKPAFLL
jgi:hypothetical protein